MSTADTAWGRARILWIGAVLVLASVPALAQPDVQIEKLTNGQDADTPPGPVLTVGAPVTWTYVVTNTGSRDLANVAVTDDQGVVVTCPGTVVLAGESMTCTASGTAQAGQYVNVGTVTAELLNGTPVTASDPSHYFGQAQASVTIEKRTNGFDADVPPGPFLPVGDPVNWTYEVTNVGSELLTGIDVTDSEGVAVSCPGTDLAPAASMTCTASGVVQPGQYVNIGSVTASLPDESPAGASDPSHYFGQLLLLKKFTNGQDADLPPGPALEAGDPVTWTYEVTNPGPATVAGLAVTDDQGVTVSCPVTTLAAGESTTCSGSGAAQPGQYANVGTATALLPAGGKVTASDPSHYVGQILRIVKSTNGDDADLPPGPVLAVGDPVSWTYEVTNLGTDPVTAVAVEDDQGVAVSCPGTVLVAGASMTCTAAGVAAAGQYTNVGTVTATHPTLGELSAADPSHYFGQDQVLDFGDAPAAYATAFAANGPRHLLGSGVYLGACVDSELDGPPSAGAGADDLTAGIQTFGTCAAAGDDEDGVVFPAPLVAGQPANAEVTASAPCTLSAWADWNADGDFADAGENLAPGGAALAAGVNPLAFPVPAAAVPGATVTRFRCTTAGAVTPVGQAPDGEVEDHPATAQAAVVAVSASKTASLAIDVDGDGLAEPGDTLAYTVLIENHGTSPATGVTFTDTPGGGSRLVVGSVTAAPGTVTGGNGAGDTTVAVDVGVLAGGGGSATITFRVTIDNPFPAGQTEVSNQGVVSGAGFADVLTDDPGQRGLADPTVVPVNAPALVEIPTLGTWSLVALALLLAGLALSRLGALRPAAARRD
jgi:uncharacterized repeat protein (TIGR01451 family)